MAYIKSACESKSLAAILRPYKQVVVADEIGVRAATVHKWYHGQSLPEPEHYTRLAAFLGMTVERLADIVAQDSKRRALARVSETAVVA